MRKSKKMLIAAISALIYGQAPNILPYKNSKFAISRIAPDFIQPRSSPRPLEPGTIKIIAALALFMAVSAARYGPV
jgi:hypothetical protein